ncbi:MAG: ABC transporter permease [Ruminococcus sp.]|nr:ABC transporter permease [Ruminococcus sp.]
MLNIIRNTFRIFSRDKDFFSSIIAEPLAMLLIFSFFLAFQNSVSVGVVNNDKGKGGKEIIQMLDDIDYLKVVEIDEDDIKSELSNDSIKLAVVIGDDMTKKAESGEEAGISIVSCKDSDDDLETYIGSLVQLKTAQIAGGSADVEMKLNKLRDTGIPINNSLGVLIFKLIGTGSMLAALFINDRKRGIADRIKLSGIGTINYLAGSGIVFLLCSMVSSVAYFLCAILFNFNFGIEHKIHFLFIMFAVNFLAMAFSMFLSAIVNDDGILWNINVMILLPTSILAGAFFDYNSMPKVLRYIGGIFPQRWISKAVEVLQNGGTFGEAMLYVLAVLAISIVLIIVSVIVTDKKLSGALKKT